MTGVTIWTHRYLHRPGGYDLQFVGRSTGESRRLIRLLFADWDRMTTIRRKAASLCSRGSCAHRSSAEDSFLSGPDAPTSKLTICYVRRLSSLGSTAQIKPTNSRATAVTTTCDFFPRAAGGGSAHTVGSAPSRQSNLRLRACVPSSRRRYGRACDSSRRIQPASCVRSCCPPW